MDRSEEVVGAHMVHRCHCTEHRMGHTDQSSLLGHTYLDTWTRRDLMNGNVEFCSPWLTRTTEIFKLVTLRVALASGHGSLALCWTLLSWLGQTVTSTHWLQA